MSSTSTTWSTDSNTKASATSSTTQNVSLDGTLSIAGGSTFTGDAAFDTNTLFVDVSENSVGIGTTTPDTSLHIVSNSSGAIVTIESQNTITDNSAPELVLFRNADLTDDGNIGAVRFNGLDHGGAETIYTTLYSEINDETHGTEDGNFYIENMVAGTLTNVFSMVKSDATILGDLTVTGNNISGSGGSIITFSGDDIEFADNVSLNTDASQIGFGVDSDVILSHSHNVGLILNTTTSSTNAIRDTLTIRHQTSGTPANGIGAALTYQQETADGNYEYGMKLAATAMDVSSGAEDFDFIVYLMESGSAVAERMRLTHDGKLKVEGYVVEGRTVIKIPATAFRANDDGVGVTHIVGSIEDDGSNFGMRPGSSTLEFFAYIDVPLGYTATKVKITGSDTANEVEVYTLDLDDGTIGSEISNSGLTVADDTTLASNHVGADDKMLLIKVATTAIDDLIYGGYVTIEAT